MCGIAGVAGPGADARTVEHMVAVQRHRGPDGRGAWSADGAALGHCRLKILDLSDAGRQPMSTPDGRYTIVYNGEVYNYPALREELSGIRFRTQTDTEVVLQAYARWGPACFERFVGMFALAIWDAHARELICARDRLGIKPLYYAELGAGLAVASEVRALLAAGVPRAANPRALYDFLARDYYEHTDETFFAGIRKLPPGTWAAVRDGRIGAPRRYWDLAEEAGRIAVSPRADDREAELLSRYEDAVRLHLRSDVPVGIALSGGLDSATLLSLIDRVHPDPARLSAFAFTFADPRYSERPFVEAMARHTGREAVLVQVEPREFAGRAEQFCRSQEEPCAGLPIFAYGRCFEEARASGHIVLMDGSGIDEALAGYTRFRPAHWADLQAAGDERGLSAEWAASGVTDDAARRQALAQMAEASGLAGDSGRGQDLTASVRPECLTAEVAAQAAGAAPAFERPFSDHLRNLMYRELRYTKLPRALRFRDRLSMAVGAELRPPFLDHRVLAYCFALPAADRIDRGVSKAILRRAAARRLPDAVRLAAKRSVQTPQREWFRGELRDWVRERIDTPSFWGRGWVDRRAGLRAMDDFFAGQGDNSFFLWQWINLELWAAAFLDQPVTEASGHDAHAVAGA
jgi:asparagine synthase (glutamine-hydrolysing)